VNPSLACFAPQYGDCSGIERYDSADPTCTITPALRGRIRRSAAIVPQTYPRYVTSVARRNSPGPISWNGAKIVAIAQLTQTSIGPSPFSASAAARST
jgi:hypothetical protein